MSLSHAFAGSLFVVAARHFYRIACITNIQKLHTFHYSTIIYIKTRNNTFRKHNFFQK